MSETPNIWVCSDWHLGHEKLVELGHREPNFGEAIVANLRAAGLRAGDALINLGDVYLYPHGAELASSVLRWLREQGVSTTLVRGNHDSTRVAKALRMGWSWVCDSTSLECHGKRIVFTHAPVESDFPEDYNVHGHLHTVEGHRGGLIRDGKHILISMELLRYRPIPLSTLVALGETPVYVLGRFVRHE